MKPLAYSLKQLSGALCLTFSSISFTLAMSATPSVQADSISDFQNSWAGKAMAHQRKLDRYSPMIDNNIQGTHNSYNSEAYRDIDSYIDPQQKVSIYDQLRLGARFLELDVHWTTYADGWPWNWRQQLLLCHGTQSNGTDWGCGLTDRKLTKGMDEIKNWLNENPNEVLILYIEDYSEGHHQDLFNQINDRIGSKIYSSGGCVDVPDTLTKDQVLNAGKQVILWKDKGCANYGPLYNMAFSGLGNIGRIWEDATTNGWFAGLFNGGVDRLSTSEIREAYATGANIINLDDMVANDSRLKAGIWSWGENEPNNSNNEDCAHQRSDGRWNDNQCSNTYFYACQHNGDNSWAISNYDGTWSGGSQACSDLGDYRFSVPTNSLENERLKAARGGLDSVWLNYNDSASEGEWQASY